MVSLELIILLVGVTLSALVLIVVFVCNNWLQGRDDDSIVKLLQVKPLPQ